MGEILGRGQKWARESLDADVEHAVQSGFELVVGDARQDVTQVDDHLVVDGLHRFVLPVDHDLQSWVAQGRKQRNEPRVLVLWRRQLERLLIKLAAVHDAGASGEQVHAAESRHRVMLEPVAEKVPVLLESNGDVLAQLERQLVHLVVVLFEELPDPAIALLRWERCFLVQRQRQRLVRHQIQVTAHVVQLFVLGHIWLEG